jgi:hypothetical protein
MSSDTGENDPDRARRNAVTKHEIDLELPPQDHARIGRRLRCFAGIVYTANPGASDEEIATVGDQGTTRAVLEPPGEAQIRQFVIEFGLRVTPGIGHGIPSLLR